MRPNRDGLREPCKLRSSSTPYAEYLALEQNSEFKHEYFAGRVYATSGGTPEHGRLAAQIILLLGDFAHIVASLRSSATCACRRRSACSRSSRANADGTWTLRDVREGEARIDAIACQLGLDAVYRDPLAS